MTTTISRSYSNQALTSEQIIGMLRKRRLSVADEKKSIDFLKDVSYFRLAAYLRPLEADKMTHEYKPTATLEKAIELYCFDNELREIIFKAIQFVEISLRTRMIQEFSTASDPFWFFDESQCINKHNFLENMSHIERDLQRSKENFIKEHYRKYGADCFPPAWKTLEVITFGTLSKLFSNHADTKTKKAIARSYSIPQHEILESWIKNLNAIRNACAHHSRLWNCIMAQTPILPSRMKGVWISNTNVDTFRLYASMCSLVYWLNAINPDNTFVHDFKALLMKYPNVDTAAMGFPENWQNEMLWA